MVPGTVLEPVRCLHQGIFLPTTAFTATLSIDIYQLIDVFVVWTLSLPIKFPSGERGIY